MVELLLKMGYGYDKKSGIVTGGSHDNGIDGIISEDKLGLDLIYIQESVIRTPTKLAEKNYKPLLGPWGIFKKVYL